MAISKAAEKVRYARAGLVLDQPFFGALVLRLELREDPSCETIWTDGKTLGFNAEFVDGLNLFELKGVLAHEVLHIACGHNVRRQNRDPKRWNKAGDYAINDILLASGFTLPNPHLSGFGTDKSAESVYNALGDDSPPPQDDQNGQSDDQSDEQGQGQSDGQGGDQGSDQSDGQGQGGEQGQGGGKGQGQGQSDDQGQGDPGGCGEVRDLPGENGRAPSQSDLDQAEAEQRVAVSQAASEARRCGNLPAELARLVEDILEAKVSWQEVLRRFCEAHARNDYSWARPNRRYQAQGIYAPSLYDEQLGNIAVGVDTSGSIGGPELNQFAAELSDIIEETRASATVIYADAQVANVEEFAPEDLPLVLDAKGGGGTRFTPVFEEIEARGLDISCLVYLTDGECYDFPREAPEYPVLWAIIGGGARDFAARVPFGEVVEVA